MKNFAIIICLLVLGTVAFGQQAASTKYTPVEGGFSIEMPADRVKIVPSDDAKSHSNSFQWAGSDGLMIITQRDATVGPTPTNDAEVDVVLGGYKKGLLEGGMTIASETPITVGAFRGISVKGTYNGSDTRIRYMVSGTRTFTIMVVLLKPSPALDEYFTKAADSFTIITPKKT